MCEWSFDATFCRGSDFVPEGNQTLDLWFTTNALPLGYNNGGVNKHLLVWRLLELGVKWARTCFRRKRSYNVERDWAMWSQRVYRNPRPTNIAAVIRRLRDEVRNHDPKTLMRLCHELPAKMNEVHRLKGKKIPSNFDPRKSPFACNCEICSS